MDKTWKQWEKVDPNEIVKAYPADVTCTPGSNEVVAIISTDNVDRDNEIVLPKGWINRRNFAGNPVVMLNHNYQSLPIGKALWVKPTDDGKSLIAKYVLSKTSETAKEVFGLMQEGILNAHSIGFVSKRASAPSIKEVEANPNWKGASLVHREFELLEFSVVGIPANSDALTLAVSKGYSKGLIDFLTVKAVEKKEGTETAIEEKPIVVSSEQVRLDFYKTLQNRLRGVK